MNLLENFDFNIAREKIKLLFYYFFNDVMLSLILFALCVLYIFLTEKNKKIRDLFGWYVVVIVVIIWNPWIMHILEEFINFSSMYRLYYMLPLYPVIAYSFTKIIQNLGKKSKKILGMIAICSVVVIFGKNIYTGWEWGEVNNLYKLPDATVFAAEVIYNDEKYDYKKALVPYGMSSQIQQIHSNIDLVYTRIITSYTREDGLPATSDTDEATNNEMIKRFNEGDTKYISELCNEQKVNYVVCYDYTELQYPLENFGFEKIGSDWGVTVYRKSLFVE